MADSANAGKLDEIASGGLDASETLVRVRELLAADASKFGTSVYHSLLEVAWRIAGDREAWQNASSWLGVFGHASSILRERGLPELSWQISALGDLVERSARFAERQPLDEVLARRHVPQVMRLLAGNAGRMDRAALIRASGLGQSNLSRMLGILDGHGLLRRAQKGRETEISLTVAGKEVAANLTPTTAAPVRSGLDPI